MRALRSSTAAVARSICPTVDWSPCSKYTRQLKSSGNLPFRSISFPRSVWPESISTRNTDGFMFRIGIIRDRSTSVRIHSQRCLSTMFGLHLAEGVESSDRSEVHPNKTGHQREADQGST